MSPEAEKLTWSGIRRMLPFQLPEFSSAVVTIAEETKLGTASVMFH